MKNLEFIYNRKSIRKFKDIQIPKEDILTLLDAATQAPSPKHQQNWHFVVLQNRDIINQMSDIVTESHTQIANLAPTKEQGEKYMRLLKYYTLFKHAPVVIIVYGNEYDMIEYDILKANGASEERLAEIIAPQSAIQGIGAAVENFLLAATAMGYGTCYMTGPTPAPKRKPLEEVVTFID